ncbi:hypothetical protein GCM10023310_69420 [Paenibacillus vulneris]|uniref:Uncharacterized protein n=1 Tax=Paenibacillus vulneris TaxID=1133364 RepID=A0ABW3UF93_9BACL
MNKIIDYINNHEIEDMVSSIVNSGKDIKDVLQQIRLSRVEYQCKSQYLQWALEKRLTEVNEYEE